VDVAPTLLDVAGLADPHPREGISRVPELRGEACREQPVYASTVAGRLVADPPTDHALRGEGRKLVLHEGGAVELYELASDPGETRNLAPSPVSDAMKALLEARAAGAAASSPELDPDTRRMLEALGYVDGG
jgi:arylsulfatase A-like enzyme